MLQLTSLFIVILSIFLILLIPGCGGKGKVGEMPKKKNGKQSCSNNSKTKTKTESTQSTDDNTPPEHVPKPVVPVEPQTRQPGKPAKTPKKSPETPEKPVQKAKKVSPKKPEAAPLEKKKSKMKQEKSTALMDLPTANDGKDGKPKPKVSNKKSIYLEEAVKKEEVKCNDLKKKRSFKTLPTQTASFKEDPLESSAKRHRDQVKPGELNEYSDDTIDDAPSIPRKEGKSFSAEKSLENVTKKPLVAGEGNQKLEKKISADEVVQEKQ